MTSYTVLTISCCRRYVKKPRSLNSVTDGAPVVNTMVAASGEGEELLVELSPPVGKAHVYHRVHLAPDTTWTHITIKATESPLL